METGEKRQIGNFASLVPGQPDRVARGRKGQDERVGATFPIMAPLVENLPAASTPLDDGFQVIARDRPGLAAWLRFLHDHVRIHMQHISREVAEREESLQHAVNVKAAEHNAKIDERAASLRERAQATLAAIAEEASAVRETHAAAEVDTASKLAAIGAAYDPSDLSESSAVRPAGATVGVAAAEMGLPAPGAQDRLYMPEWAGWYCSVVVGLLIGMSLLVVAHALRPDTVARHPAIAAFGAAIGFGIAIAGKWAVRLFWVRVGQYYLVPRSFIRWVRAIVIAAAATTAILGADMALETQGLLALASLQARMDSIGANGLPDRQTASQTVFFLCVAFTVTGAYVLHSAVEGYMKGRDGEIRGSASASVSKTEIGHDQAQRTDQAVRAAQNALSSVRLHRRHLAELAERAASVQAEAERSASALDAAKLPEDVPLSPEGRLLIQDSVDDARSAGITFTQQFEAALADVEGKVGTKARFRKPHARLSFWRRWLR